MKNNYRGEALKIFKILFFILIFNKVLFAKQEEQNRPGIYEQGIAGAGGIAGEQDPWGQKQKDKSELPRKR